MTPPIPDAQAAPVPPADAALTDERCERVVRVQNRRIRRAIRAGEKREIVLRIVKLLCYIKDVATFERVATEKEPS